MGRNITLKICKFSGKIRSEFRKKSGTFFCICSAAESHIVPGCRQGSDDSGADPAGTACYQYITLFHFLPPDFSFSIYFSIKYSVKEKNQVLFSFFRQKRAAAMNLHQAAAQQIIYLRETCGRLPIEIPGISPE
jgi:hypothetical protein